MQRTINTPITIKGVGIHSGSPVTIMLLPAPIDTGILFRRSDLKLMLSGTADVFQGVNNQTCVMYKGEEVFKTVEHVLSAIHGLEIDNIIIEANSAEMPATDGSAGVFVEEILKAGIENQEGKGKEYLELEKSIIEFGEGDTFIAAVPSDIFKISLAVEYAEYPFIGVQVFSNIITPDFYIKEIASARTLGKVRDLEKLLSLGKAKGVTLNNAIGIADEGYSCALRYPDEIVRHKVMDLIGDLAGVQKKIKAHIIGLKTNHRLNVKFMKKLSELAHGSQ